MNRSRLRQVALVVSALALTFATITFVPSHSTVQAAQEPQPQGPPPGGPPPGGMPPREMPKPTNLKVLPKDLTGKQVHDIMEKWEGSLGAKCTTCHAQDPNRKMPNGRPALNFADDSKEDKKIARMMYTMVQLINTDYVSKVPNSGAPVTCGTCHRGHLGPEPFEPGKEEEHPH